jgi:enoyl-CoA hydratase/carnithine racemase
MSILSVIRPDGVMVITLNRPERMNALDVPCKERLGELWAEAAADRNVRVIVLSGAGERAFCAGSDIKEIQRTGKMVTTDILMNAIPDVGIELNKPTIAAMHGFTVGFGLTLAIHCDIRIAQHGSRIGFPEVQHGMISGVSAVTLPGIIGEPAALDIMLTGRLVDDAEALRIGLVNAIVPNAAETAIDKAKQLAANSPKAIALTKGLILGDRRNRVLRQAANIDAARIAVTTSDEYADVVGRKAGTGKIRSS